MAQLHPNDLIAGPRTVTIVSVGAARDGGLVVSLDDGSTYRPSLQNQSRIARAFGHDGSAWTGKRILLSRCEFMYASKPMTGIHARPVGEPAPCK
jgi:hypothetical protein